jgi:hypothetical protein
MFTIAAPNCPPAEPALQGGAASAVGVQLLRGPP